MFRRRLSLGALLAVSLTATTFWACAGGPEDAILTHFFTAARLRDNTTLGSFSNADFDPREQGIITSFTITNIGSEQHHALTLKALAQEYEAAKAADADLTKRKDAYAGQNMDVVQQIVKAGRDGKFKGKDAEIQAAWFKFVDEGAAVGRRVSDARRKLAAERDLVDLSVAEPGKTIDVTKYDGDLVSKDVTISAPVKLPTGQTVTKTLVITLQRAELKADKPIVGRWIVAVIKEPGTSGGTKAS